MPTFSSTDLSETRRNVAAAMKEPPESIRVTNPELATVRKAMRELHRLLDQLDRGDLEKVVLTQRNHMRAVLVTVERYAELERNVS